MSNVETQQALSGTGKICHWHQHEKRLGGAVPGPQLGIAPNATCGIIIATMRRFGTSSTLLHVTQRKNVFKAQAAATGHEEAQATATGQEKKSAATGDNEQALAEAPSSATGQRRRDDKLLLAPRPTCFTVDSHSQASRLTYFTVPPHSQASRPTFP